MVALESLIADIGTARPGCRLFTTAASVAATRRIYPPGDSFKSIHI